MKIDTKKLLNTIAEEIESVAHGIYSSSTTVLVNVPGYQVQLVTTRDEDDFIENPNPDDLITND